MSDFDSVLNVEGAPDVKLMGDIKEMIILAESERPRSVQRVPGPSEVAHPCQRKLGYLINRARSERPESSGYNRTSDPLAAIMGTSMHAWLEDAAQTANKRLGRVRWVTEQRVVVRAASETGREELAGTGDLYDLDTHTVLDWKVPGASMYADYVKNGPSEQYRGQVHLYGQGFKRLGFPVEHVGIVFISRTGTLRQTHLWREPYDQALVDKILGNLDSVESSMERYGVSRDPSGFLRLPISPGKYCHYCPWFSPNPTGPFQCQGNG